MAPISAPRRRGFFLVRTAVEAIMASTTKREIPNQVSSAIAEPGVTERVWVDPGLVEALRHAGHRHYGRLAIFLVLFLAAAFVGVAPGLHYRLLRGTIEL